MKKAKGETGILHLLKAPEDVRLYRKGKQRSLHDKETQVAAFQSPVFNDPNELQFVEFSGGESRWFQERITVSSYFLASKNY